MKVVLFCGGYGMRMRGENGADVPKPMAMIGPRPLIWHVMRYYARHGHSEFILCLGYGARQIKEFFLDYQEELSNDFVLRDGKPTPMSTDIADWTITFVQTGFDSAIGERLRRVREHLEGEEMFLANYADVLTDASLPQMIAKFQDAEAGASMMVVPPQASFHCVELGQGNLIDSIIPVAELPLWENGGYFVLRQEIFEHIPQDGDLVVDGCGQLAKQGRLLAFPYRGFWRATDTAKERHELERAYLRGECPWAVCGADPDPAHAIRA